MKLFASVHKQRGKPHTSILRRSMHIRLPWVVVVPLSWLLVFGILNVRPTLGQSLKPVVFAVSATDVSASPIFVAEDLGYFKAEGDRFKNCRDPVGYCDEGPGDRRHRLCIEHQ